MSSTHTDITEHESVRRHLARCSRMLDSRDFEGWVDTFTPDGVFNDNAGRDDLLAWILDGQLAKTSADELQRRHTLHNIEVEVDGDRASAVSEVLMVDKVAGAPSWSVLGVVRFTDELTRTPDGWRIRRRDGVPMG